MMTAHSVAHRMLVVGDSAEATAAQLARGQLCVVDCHSARRGPFTAAGSLVRALLPSVIQSQPHLVRRHLRPILSVAPEAKPYVLELAPDMAHIVGMVGEVPAPFSHLGRDEGFPVNARARALAHGVVDFVLGFAAGQAHPPLGLAFHNVDRAEPLDQEFLAILLRCSRPEILRVILTCREPPGAGPLAEAIEANGVATVRAAASAAPAPAAPTEELARAYVWSDGASRSPAERSAYEALDPAARRRLHRLRLEELEAADDISLRLGPIPHHCDLAFDGDERSARLEQALYYAARYCLTMGFYLAALDYAGRGLALGPRLDKRHAYFFFQAKTVSLVSLGRIMEAKAWCEATEAEAQDLEVRAGARYFQAVLHASYLDQASRDYDVAYDKVRAAAADLRAAGGEAHNVIFVEHSTTALVEFRKGRPEDAVRILTEGLDRLARDAPDKFRADSALLIRNRARVHVTIGKFAAAIPDYDRLVEREPFVPEHLLNRGSAYRALGDLDKALADFDAAIDCGLPHWEFYNARAAVLSLTGRDADALHDYRRVLELEPGLADARVNAVSILLQENELEQARIEAQRGLALDPDNAELLCMLGLVLAAQEEPGPAFDLLSRALAHNPRLRAAWINRGALAFERGDFDAAVADFDRALDLERDYEALYNRGVAHQSRGDWSRAAADLTEALGCSDDDREEIERRLADCREALAAA